MTARVSETAPFGRRKTCQLHLFLPFVSSLFKALERKGGSVTSGALDVLTGEGRVQVGPSPPALPPSLAAGGVQSSLIVP